MSPRRVPCPVHRNARANPAGLAFKGDGLRASWAEFEARVREWERGLAGHLADATGVGAGTDPPRIAVLAANSLDYAALIFAALRRGVSLVPLNLRRGGEHWRDALERTRAARIYCDAPHLAFAEASGRPRTLFPSGGTPAGQVAPPSSDATEAQLDLDTEASVFFSSGSTGRPKGVRLRYGNHHFNALAANANLPLAPGDCWLASLPFYHVGGMAILFRGALAGSACHLVSGFDPAEIRRLVEAAELTHISCVPSMLAALLDAGAPLASLRAVLLGGAPAGRRLLARCAEAGVPVLPSYGMTEAASQIATCSLGDSPGKLESSGRVLEHAELRIAGAAGEIQIRGATLFAGYLGEATGAALTPDGWFPTGDLGTLDAEGYLRVHGRADTLFISGGENVHPEEIEAAALEHPGLAECAVIALPHEKWGQRPLLYAVPAVPATSQEAIERYLAERLPRLLRPEAVILVEALPRGALGKIDRAALLARHLGREREG